MSFERARTEENKKIRLEQIKEAAIRLFDEIDYHEISLASIAKELKFTRANLYKYVSSKEEIFLYVVQDEIETLIKDFKDHFDTKKPLSINDFASIWATTLYKHPRFLQLSSILNQIVERNSSLEKLVAFKKQYLITSDSLYQIIQDTLPDFTEQDILQFIQYQMAFSTGLYPMSNPSAIQLEAGRLANVKHHVPDFIKSVETHIKFTINGIRASKNK